MRQGMRHVAQRRIGIYGVPRQAKSHGAWLFTILAENKDELIDLAIETDIDDYEDDEKNMIFFTSSENFLKSIDVFKKNNYVPSSMEVEMQADTKVKLTDDDNDSFVKFLDALEELDDVQNVYSNAEFLK